MDITWNGLEPRSAERLHLVTAPDSITATSAVRRADLTYEYRVQLAADWSFSELVADDGAGRTLQLRRSDEGEWTVDGIARPDLSEAVDIDLSFSPFTNTLPIRRLALPVGAARDIVTAYVTRGLDVLPDPQRYTRLAADRYLYESRDSDFCREITVDVDGLVVDYPGLFARS